mmetsp:Transcript_15677/g.24400  ORF Transcript_15677/g.24400 Transcript_15677/m.24400 type:complete len:403 (+) Transcript_15677:91-1299(+)
MAATPKELHITVSDPIHVQDGMNKYTAYHIHLNPNTNSNASYRQDEDVGVNYFSAGGGAVLRRYSDFCWLVERFQTERGGAIVPPLPEKQPVNRFNPMFVAQRAAMLQVFLNEVYVHPELYDAECLHTFLRADEGTFALAKRQAEHEKQAQGGLGNIAKWFGGGNAGHVPKQQTQEDLIMAQLGNDLKEWEVQIKSVLTHSQKLVKKSKEIANGYFEMGLAFSLLGQSESDVLGRALTRMGQSSDKISIITAEHSEKEFSNYETPLSYYLKVVHSARSAVKCRLEAKEYYYFKLSEVNKNQSSLEKNRNRPGKEEKFYHTQGVLRRVQEESEIALNNYNAINQRVMREMDRFKRETEVQMKKIIREYVALQAEYYKKIEDIWSVLIRTLEEEKEEEAVVAGA